jgi:hypothetical protein
LQAVSHGDYDRLETTTAQPGTGAARLQCHRM